MAKRLKTFLERMKTDDFPEPATFNNAEECAAAYESGYEGVFYDPDGAEEVESQQDGKFGDVAREYGLEDNGKGKLTLLYPEAWKVSGRDDWYHGSKSQPTGDCVSRGQSHAAIASLAVACANGKGSWPEIPESAYQTGMPFHPSPTYWNKHGGISGWSCSRAAMRSKDKIGLTLSIAHSNPNIGDLLTRYDTRTIGKYVRNGPPDDVIKDLNDHCTLTYTRIKSLEEIRDALASGYGINSCGGQGFSRSRDAHGVSKRSGHWSHSMSYIGFDDTEFAHTNYGGPLVLVLNSWGTSFFHGSRKVHGRDQCPEIPKGAFWARWNDVAGRDCYGFSAVQGWPPMKLTDWGEAISGLI